LLQCEINVPFWIGARWLGLSRRGEKRSRERI
jgi:hypothetical protein